MEVAGEVGGDEGDGFLGVVHHVGFVDDVEVSDGGLLLEVVCEELAADGEAADGGLEGSAAEERSDGCVGVAGVDDEEAFWRKKGERRRGGRGVSSGVNGGNVVVGVE